MPGALGRIRAALGTRRGKTIAVGIAVGGLAAIDLRRNRSAAAAAPTAAAADATTAGTPAYGTGTDQLGYPQPGDLVGGGGGGVSPGYYEPDPSLTGDPLLQGADPASAVPPAASSGAPPAHSVKPRATPKAAPKPPVGITDTGSSVTFVNSQGHSAAGVSLPAVLAKAETSAKKTGKGGVVKVGNTYEFVNKQGHAEAITAAQAKKLPALPATGAHGAPAAHPAPAPVKKSTKKK